MGSTVGRLCLGTDLTERHPGRLFWVFPGPDDLAPVCCEGAAEGSFCERALDIFSGMRGGGGGGGGGSGPGCRGGLLRMIEHVCVDTTLKFENQPVRIKLPARTILGFYHHEVSKFAVRT